MSTVHVDAAVTMDDLRAIAALFADVWGRNEDGVPIGSEMLRSLVHADGLVSAARSPSGELVGAAALGRAAPGRCYGYIAAAAPGHADRGIGWALKQHQRTWSMEHDVHTMTWTFDPLVSRNARFNLTKLGAVSFEYETAFYGEMADALNAGEVGDRLVATWRLGSARATAAARGTAPERAAISPPAESGVARGPDGELCAWTSETDRWIRVPHDIVALRTGDPARANAWRLTTREQFTAAFADGWVADAVERDGTYHLTHDDEGLR